MTKPRGWCKISSKDVNGENKYNRSFFYKACQREHLSCMRQLLALGADVNFAGSANSTMLYEATRMGYADGVALLLQHGASMKTPQKLRTPLHEAARSGNIPILRMLIEAGSDINPDDADKTPIQLAAHQNHYEAVVVLVEAGASINQLGNEGDTTMTCAAAACDGRIVPYLLKHGGDPHAVDGYGDTAVHRATCYGTVEALEALLAAGVDPFGKAENDWPLLYDVAANNKPARVMLLLERGADPNKPTKWGNVPLIAACKVGNLSIVKALISSGASVNHRDKDGDTALDVSIRKEHHDIIAYLFEHGANIDDIPIPTLKYGNTAVKNTIQQAIAKRNKNI